MVYDAAIAWPQLEGFDEAVLAERDACPEMQNIELSISRHFIVNRHFKHVIRLATAPTRGERRHRGQVRRVTPRGAGIHPAHDGLDLGICKAGIIAELPEAAISRPRRHLSSRHRTSDRTGP